MPDEHEFMKLYSRNSLNECNHKPIRGKTRIHCLWLMYRYSGSNLGFTISILFYANLIRLFNDTFPRSHTWIYSRNN